MIVRSDAGHGGKDPGAVNGRFKEAEFVLDIDREFCKYLNKQGVKTSRSRVGNSFVSLGNRNPTTARFDAFVSHHMNSFGNKNVNGIEVLYNNNNPQSKRLAQYVLNELLATGLFVNNRGLKMRNNLAVLRSKRSPSILIEYGFISNNKEAQRVLNNKTKLSQAAARGVLKFLGVKVKEEKKEEVIMVDYKIDNKNHKLKTIKRNGEHYVNVKDIARAIGMDTGYIPSTKTVVLDHNKLKYKVIGKRKEVDHVKISGKNYPQFREIVEDLGYTVNYDNKTKEVSVDVPLEDIVYNGKVYGIHSIKASGVNHVNLREFSKIVGVKVDYKNGKIILEDE